MTQKNLTLAQIRKRLAAHNFEVHTNVLCPITMRRKWRYAAIPTRGGGHSHFSNKKDLVKFLLQVERVASY